MSSKVYESAVLINAGLEDSQIELILNRIKDTISGNGGEIREIENWGRKRLAYVVKKNKLGYYAIFRFDSPPELISKLERFYQLDENILRYLTIKLDAEALEQIEKEIHAAAWEIIRKEKDKDEGKSNPRPRWLDLQSD